MTLNSLTLILGCLILAAFLAPFLPLARHSPKLQSVFRAFRRALGLHAGIMRINAITDGPHGSGMITRLADAAISTRYLLVKPGSDADHFAVSDATSIPLGVCVDEPAAAESGASILVLGVAKGTVLMIAGEAIGADVDVYAGTNGKIMTTGVVKVGRSLTAASGDGIKLEVAPCTPTVAPNGSNTVAGGTLAIPVTKRYVSKTTGGVEALSLDNGLPGQRLTIVLAVDGGDGTLTPTTKTGFTNIVFADAKDTAELLYVDDTIGWTIAGLSGAAAPPAFT